VAALFKENALTYKWHKLACVFFELKVEFLRSSQFPGKLPEIDHARRRKVCEIFAIPRKLFENQPNFKTPRKSTKCPRERGRERERGTGGRDFVKCSKTKIL
jgi:hypothetical protein